MSELDLLGWVLCGLIGGVAMGLVLALWLHDRMLTRLENAVRTERLFWKEHIERLHNRLADPRDAAYQSEVALSKPDELVDPATRVKRYGESQEPSLGDLERVVSGVNDELAGRGIDPSEL